MSNSTLGTYLNDHLAMVTSEIELLGRCAKENDGSPLAMFLSDTAGKVEGQANGMRRILDSEGLSESSIKQAAAWFAEKVGRLKPNDGGTGYTDLARVIELETLICFAESRRLLWQSVGQIHLPERVRTESESFVRQATAQIESLREHHHRAIATAFSTSEGAAP